MRVVSSAASFARAAAFPSSFFLLAALSLNDSFRPGLPAAAGSAATTGDAGSGATAGSGSVTTTAGDAGSGGGGGVASSRGGAAAAAAAGSAKSAPRRRPRPPSQLPGTMSAATASRYSWRDTVPLPSASALATISWTRARITSASFFESA